MDKQNLKAEKRTALGRKNKKLRREGFLPANIYGKGVKSLSVQVETGTFEKVFKETGETGIIEISLEKDKKPVLVHNVQYDPVTNLPLHVDFLQVDLKQKVTAGVPVELVGESPAEKEGKGTVIQHIDEIEVEALPADLPDKFEVDASSLDEVDKSILVKDISFDKAKIKIELDPEETVAKVEALREEEEEVPQAPVEEGEGAGVEEKKEEGEEGQGKEESSEKAPEENKEEK